MMNRSMLRGFPIALLVISLSFGVNAYAWKGMGGGQGGGKGCYGKGAGQGGYGCAWQVQLSEEEQARLKEERKAFFDATSELRGQIYQKELDLKKELALENADKEKVLALQKEITGLQGQLSEQWIEHMFKIRQINPNLGRGYMGRGSGHGCGGGGYKRGGRGSGCPYSGGLGG